MLLLKKKTHRLFLKKNIFDGGLEENENEVGKKSVVFDVFGVTSFLYFGAGKTNYDNLTGKSFAHPVVLDEIEFEFLEIFQQLTLWHLPPSKFFMKKMPEYRWNPVDCRLRTWLRSSNRLVFKEHEFEGNGGIFYLHYFVVCDAAFSYQFFDARKKIEKI